MAISKNDNRHTVWLLDATVAAEAAASTIDHGNKTASNEVDICLFCRELSFSKFYHSSPPPSKMARKPITNKTMQSQTISISQCSFYRSSLVHKNNASCFVTTYAPQKTGRTWAATKVAIPLSYLGRVKRRKNYVVRLVKEPFIQEYLKKHFLPLLDKIQVSILNHCPLVKDYGVAAKQEILWAWRIVLWDKMWEDFGRWMQDLRLGAEMIHSATLNIASGRNEKRGA